MIDSNLFFDFSETEKMFEQIKALQKELVSLKFEKASLEMRLKYFEKFAHIPPEEYLQLV